MTKEQVEQIIEEEDLERVLRTENFAMLKHLVSQQEADTINIFTMFAENEDQEYLISYVEAKTEDALQYLFIQRFTNQEIAKVRMLRS